MIRKTVISLFFITTACNTTMQLHEFGTRNFSHDPVCTEWSVYKILKHNPLKKEVNYLAIPWSFLYEHNGLAAIPREKINGGFTICQHIHFKEIIPTMKELGIDTLFTPHADCDVYKGITLVPFPHFPVNGVEPSPIKDIWYSFVGYNTDESRNKLFKMQHPENAVIKKRSKYHFWQHADKQDEEEYKDTLARSRFSLCPRGTGPSTIRFWESLQAGAIPILISDTMRLPKGIDWESCIIRISEKRVSTLFHELEKISPEQERLMRKNCLKVYEYLCHGNNFVNCIRMYYEDK